MKREFLLTQIKLMRLKKCFTSNGFGYSLIPELVGRAGCASARPGPRPAGDAMHQPESLPAIQSNLRRFSSCTLTRGAQKREKRP